MINRRGTTGIVCFVFFLLFYGITARAKLQASDEAATLATGISLATEGDVAIDNLQWLQDILNIGQPGRDGHLYAKYFPGNVFTAALLYSLTETSNDQPYNWNFKEIAPSNTGARIALMTNALWGALAMTFLLLALSRYFSWRTTLMTVFIVGVCTDWWYQSRGFFSEIGAGAFLTGSLYFMTEDRPYLSSLALAISLLFRPTNLLGLPLWGKTVWGKDLRKVAASVIFIIGSIMILGLYNWLRFNSPVNFGYGNEKFVFTGFDGLYGVLLSPGRSLFVYSPILILAIPGLWLMYRQARSMTIVCLSTIAGYVLAIAAWHMWDGGWSWGSRLLTPIVPMLGFFCAPVIDRLWHRRWLAAIIVLLALLGLSVEFLALARDPIRVMNETVGTGSLKYTETIHSIDNSWAAIQFRSLKSWQICDLDAYWLRRLLSCAK